VNDKYVSLATICRFLVGQRDAIRQISDSRGALWLGLLFVLSAGFAREYDGEDLLHEPWHLLIPLAASVASSFLLYCLIHVVARMRGVREPFWLGYRRLLALYWLTAPLAWLYAIPFERFTSAPQAVSANLWLLGIVALWRVALMTRVVSVLYQCHWLAALFVVMLFADAVAVTAIILTPRPVVGMMGGIRHSESEQVILNVTCAIQGWGILLLPVWLIGVICIAFLGRKKATPPWQSPNGDPDARRPVSKPVWAIAVFAILIWALVLPLTQAEQKNRRTVTVDLRAGRIDQAISFMSDRTPQDFPPHWNPPPRLGYAETNPRYHEVLDAVIRADAAPWVRQVYVDKLIFHANSMRHPLQLGELSDEQLRRYRDLLREIPEGQAIAASHRYQLQQLLRGPGPHDIEPPPELTTERRELLTDIRAIAGVDEDE
jgi:hypothetical protein